MSEPQPPAEKRAGCPAVLMVAGEAYSCDWPTDENGQHKGWGHTNAAAEAVWCGDEGPADRSPTPPTDGEVQS